MPSDDRGQRPPQLFLGLAIWGYEGWRGDLFPVGTPRADYLSLYSHYFPCVEGNTTFYATPTIATVERWASLTPAGFKFCPKLPKQVSHQGLLRPKLALAQNFFGLMQAWGDRLGPLFLQLPPRYGPLQWDDLQGFLLDWTAAIDAPIALEVRHRDWFLPRHEANLMALLEDLSVARVLLDTRPIYEAPPASLMSLPPEQQDKKPNLPLRPQLTADFTLVRYVSHPELERNQAHITAWVDRLVLWLSQGITVYCFIHCPIEAQSPVIARWFQSQLAPALAHKGLAVHPLPWQPLPTGGDRGMDDRLAQQLGLFDGLEP
jgi:uncharacterized protein YecE (DUF72 family)